jgi:hypothetical protein
MCKQLQSELTKLPIEIADTIIFHERGEMYVCMRVVKKQEKMKRAEENGGRE